MTTLPAGGALGAPGMRYLFDWADREGVADPEVVRVDFGEINFAQQDARFFDGVSGRWSGSSPATAKLNYMQ